MKRDSKEVAGLGGLFKAGERMAEAVKLPRDVFPGDLLISLIGREEVLVENYRSSLLYTDSVLCVQGKNCRLKVCGRSLRIAYYTSDAMKVNGMIQKVELDA